MILRKETETIDKNKHNVLYTILLKRIELRKETEIFFNWLILYCHKFIKKKILKGDGIQNVFLINCKEKRRVIFRIKLF